MSAAHVTGGALGVALGAILASLLRRFGGVSLSYADAALLGGALGAAGVGIAHAVWHIGLGPIFARILHGPGSKPGPQSPGTAGP